MTTIGMAWRNVLRQKRRTLITLSALIVGLVGLVVFQGYVGQLMRGLRDKTIRAGIGHIQISASERYFEDGEYNPFAYVMQDAAERQALLQKDPDVLAVFPSTGFTSIAGLGEKSITLLVKGYPIERMYFAPASGSPPVPEDRFGLGTLVSGALPQAGQRDGIVLGQTAARILGAQVGGVITLMAILPNGGLAGRDFTVCAIFSSPGMDKNFAYTDFETARDFTSMDGAPVLHVLLRDITQTSAVVGRLSPGAVYRTWRDLATYYVRANTLLIGFQRVIQLIILLVALFILANTMNRIVFERTREWGTLRAMGTKKRSIMWLVVLEGCLQGLVGAVIGIGLGFAISALANLGGGIPYHDGMRLIMVRVKPELGSILPDLVPVVFTAALAAFFPGLRAIRLTPAECLRQK